MTDMELVDAIQSEFSDNKAVVTIGTLTGRDDFDTLVRTIWNQHTNDFGCQRSSLENTSDRAIIVNEIKFLVGYPNG